MKSRSLFFSRSVALCLLFAAAALSAFAADDDPDPNSPTPVLLSFRESTRALAVEGRAAKRVDLATIQERAFSLDSQITLFVANLKFMQDEGASALRVYAQDAQGRYYRFPVVAVEALGPQAARGMYAVTVQLTDQTGYWPTIDAHGDVLLMLTWRGLGSNRVRLGIGQTRGGPADDKGAVPTPPGTTTAKTPNGPAQGDYVGYKWSGDRMRFLEQATFGPNQALDSRIRRIGLRTWLEEQFSTQYPDPSGNCASYPNVADGLAYPCQPLKPDNPQADCDGNQTTPDVPVTCFRDTYSQYPLQTWFFRQAYYGDAQLRHRVAWALAQIWVTSAVDLQQSRHMIEYHKILSNNSFGNYRTLMKQMTLNPAMGEYLSMVLSTKNNPNENYAREIMQLFTIGLFMLDQQGRLQCTEHPGQAELCQPGDTLIPTYDQNGVNNLTKVFTGWSRCQNAANPLCGNFVAGTQNYIDPMILSNRNNHDLTAKTLLTWPADPNFPPNNTNIPPCTGCTGTAIDTYAATSMDQALDNIYNHPNVAPFVSKILIQHLVTSDPTPAYVGRVAAVFNANRSSSSQMKEVVKAILLDPEARGDVKTDPFYGKLREPVQFTTNLFRTFNVRAAGGTGQSDGSFGVIGQGRTNGQVGDFIGMSQVPFLSPTVFNFYPPDYVVPGTAMLGPEFALQTTGTAIQRANFMNRMCFSNIPIPVATPDYPSGTSLDFSDLQALAGADLTNGLLLDELNRRMLHSTMSDQMKSTISTAVTAVNVSNPPTAAQLLQRARTAVYLVATSSQYQVQR